jgi:hypothetical protein
VAEPTPDSVGSFAHTLAVFDELLGACGLDSPLIANVSFEARPARQRQRLERSAECLKLLEAVWPGPRGHEHDWTGEDLQPRVILRAAG